MRSSFGYQSAAKSFHPGLTVSTSLFFFSRRQPLISFFVGDCCSYARESFKVDQTIAFVFASELSAKIVLVFENPLVEHCCNARVQSLARRTTHHVDVGKFFHGTSTRSLAPTRALCPFTPKRREWEPENARSLTWFGMTSFKKSALLHRIQGFALMNQL